MPTSNTPIPEVVKTEIAYHGYFDVQIKHLQLPNGPQRPYTVLDVGADAAAVIALTPDGKLVMTYEYRHPSRQWLLSCPGGRIDPGESPIEAAQRELLEETGYGKGTLSLLGSVYPFPSVSEQKIFFILAQNVTYVQPPALDPFELIHVQLKSFQEIVDLIAAGSPVDGVFCSGLFLWSNRR